VLFLSLRRLAARLQGRSPQRFLSLFSTSFVLSLLLALVSTGFTACSAPGNGNVVELTLVSNAVTEAAYREIMPLFAAEWEQKHQQIVVFNQSYGGSGTQARAVIEGLPADIVDLALELDVEKIEAAGLIQPGWQDRVPNGAIAHQSVAALVTRSGNPKSVSTWADLSQDQVSVITANPRTSGGARWNFLALWGAITQTGGDQQAALDYTTQVFENIPILPRDAREATDAFFQQGQGDVLINYENEIILAKLNGQDIPYLIPETNISIDNPVAVIDANVDQHGTREVAEAFIQFLFTPAAQREFARFGFRPVDEAVNAEFADQFPPVPNLFTIADMGGWNTVQQKFFDEGGVFDQIQADLTK
jgi:sulfate transport system substrate-binding protein